MKIKLKAFIGGYSFDFSANCANDLMKEIIKTVFRSEIQTARNKTDAVLNTAVILDIDERTVWRTLANGKSDL